MQFKLLVLLKLVIVGAFGTLAITQLLPLREVHAARPMQNNPLPATERNLAFGLDHFMAHCATCHGEWGKADTEKGKQVRADDLTATEAQSKSDAELFRIISKGIPGTAMPGFSKSHKPEEIWQTILFVRKLPTLTPAERQQLAAALPPEARHRHDEQMQMSHQHDETTADKGAEQKKSESSGGHQHDAQSTDANSSPQHRHGEAQGDQSMNHNDHDMGNHDMAAMMSTLTGGPYQSMHAIGSGTSLLPASSPGYMWHWMAGEWVLMLHGDLKVGFNHQGGPRGINKAESQNWLMFMAERNAGDGRLMLRAMLSAEPATAPRRGFPQLFQTGESFNNRPLIDAQHPHDLFMELAAAYTVPLAENVSLNFYGGPVAEPALGPVAFMHRPSASENPAAPLGHHWHDSTHIAHGVFTLGITAGKFKLEGSIFRGAEPDENRTTIDFGKLDSYSGRLWFAPTQDWTMQVSYGFLTKPEIAEPGNLRRLTASIHHNHSWEDGYWASSLIWGRNDEERGVSNNYLLESTLNFRDKNYLYTRLELGDRIGLLQENIFGRPGLIPAQIISDDPQAEANGISAFDELAERAYRVAAFTFGGVRDFISTDKLRLGIGADVTFYNVPDGLKPIYGSSPKSYHLFLRFRPGKMH